ncbi:Type-4 ice-structuring protein LS-12 [Oryzias melastigma]|uniref:Type-4 ice-structuring protein LS-12 n=1 Tax=Oryzias melastigma TaxID=30732 RepID=A0A834KZH9_ORYME|nr:type-4 ice-structuring protein [Oryzias melastigma]KAF6737812.1 Type-4 ice-structuring protein LS-12 [Oryzias melastigma]
MRLSIIATLLVLVLAHGAFADELEDLLKDIQVKMSNDFREIVNNPEVQNQAKVFLEEKRGQLEPAVEQIQPHVDPFIEKVQSFFDRLKEELAKTSKK